MTPYVSTVFTVRRPDGLSVLTLTLEDDQAGCIRIADEETSILVDADEIPALIQALRMIGRDNRRVEREMWSEPTPTDKENP